MTSAEINYRLLEDSIASLEASRGLLGLVDREAVVELRLIAETVDSLACRLRRFAHDRRLSLFAEPGE